MSWLCLTFAFACNPDSDKTSSDRDQVPNDTDILDDSGCVQIGGIQLEERVSWFYWGGQVEPFVEFNPVVTQPPCERFVVTSNVDWLDIDIADDGSLLAISLLSEEIVSGRHQALIQVQDSEYSDVLIEIPVGVSALVSPSNSAQIHRRALVVGVDGLDGQEMYNSETPVIDELQNGGVWTRNAITQLTGATSSGPGWTSILSGVEVEDHSITYNGGYEQRNTDFPSFLWVLKQEGYRTAASIQWGDVFDILESDAFDESFGGNQDEVHQWVVEHLHEPSTDVYFLHLDDVDHAGHAYGFTADSPEYVEAIETVDEDIGRLLDAILDSPTIENEEWLVLLTSDHGGDTAGTHGTVARDYQIIPFIAAGPTLEKTALPEGFGSLLDVHPTLLEFFDVEPYSELDGISWINPPEYNCDDGIDNDNDGQSDCLDSDCSETHLCYECPQEDLGSSLGTAVVDNIVPIVNYAAGTCGGDSGLEATFQWVAPSDGDFVFDTMEWYRDTVLYVRDGACGGEELACNDEPNTGFRSVVNVSLVQDQLVSIFIDSFEGEQEATGLSIYPKSDSCEATEIMVDNWQEDFQHQDHAWAGTCVPAISPFWWSWTAPATGTYYIDTSVSTFDTVLYVLDGCQGNELLCNDDDGSLSAGGAFDASEGQTVVIGVGSFAGRGLSGTIGFEIE